jgi:hypothetical protein
MVRVDTCVNHSDGTSASCVWICSASIRKANLLSSRLVDVAVGNSPGIISHRSSI